MGDAMLVVFSMEDKEGTEMAEGMVDAVRNAEVQVANMAARVGHPVAVGFGCHIGEVIYGNIGTPERLDFTVMGSAVNLASRLEALSKSVDSTAVFSTSIQAHYPELISAGKHTLKGFSEPIPVWTLPSE